MELTARKAVGLGIFFIEQEGLMSFVMFKGNKSRANTNLAPLKKAILFRSQADFCPDDCT